MSGVHVDIMLRAEDVPFAYIGQSGLAVVRLDNRAADITALFITAPTYLDEFISQLETVRDAWAAQRSEQVAS